jgi:TolA-binding protein
MMTRVHDALQDVNRMSLDHVMDAERRAMDALHDVQLHAPEMHVLGTDMAAAERAMAMAHNALLEHAGPIASLDAAQLESLLLSHGGLLAPDLVPPAPTFLPQDTGDSLYRAAHQNMNHGEYRRAAELFHLLSERYPASGYVRDAMYYEAFSLYRIGGQHEARQAVSLLDAEIKRYGGTAQLPDVEQLRTRVLGDLAAQGDTQAKSLVTTAAQQGQSCNRDEMAVKIEALNALSRMAMDSSKQILQRVLARRDECSQSLRQQAIMVLAKKSDAANADILIETVKNDPSLSVRRTALNWLATMPGDRVVSVFDDVLRSPKDSSLHGSAMRALASMDDPRAKQAVSAYVERTDIPRSIRSEAITSMARRPDTLQASAALRALYAKLSDQYLKAQIVSSVSRFRDDETRKWLAALVRNPAESVSARANALSTFRSSNTPIADVVALYDAMAEFELKRSLIQTLGARKEPEATDKLLAIARDKSDNKLRLAAISALSQKNDPRTQKLLLEIIGG